MRTARQFGKQALHIAAAQLLAVVFVAIVGYGLHARQMHTRTLALTLLGVGVVASVMSTPVVDLLLQSARILIGWARSGTPIFARPLTGNYMLGVGLMCALV